MSGDTTSREQAWLKSGWSSGRFPFYAGWNAGRTSRDAEVAALKDQLADMKYLDTNEHNSHQFARVKDLRGSYQYELRRANEAEAKHEADQAALRLTAEALELVDPPCGHHETRTSKALAAVKARLA